jgi:hypothetical protein
MRRWITIALSLALVLPPVVMLVAFAVSGGTALASGQPLFWPAQPVTLTEAIGMQDTAEIIRQISLGANPNVRYNTWDILKRYQNVSVTPLEAAIAMREQYLFDMLVAHGAMLTAENASTLHCFAVQEHASEIAAYVAARFPPPPSCDGVPLPW